MVNGTGRGRNKLRLCIRHLDPCESLLSSLFLVIHLNRDSNTFIPEGFNGVFIHLHCFPTVLTGTLSGTGDGAGCRSKEPRSAVSIAWTISRALFRVRLGSARSRILQSALALRLLKLSGQPLIILLSTGSKCVGHNLKKWCHYQSHDKGT